MYSTVVANTLVNTRPCLGIFGGLALGMVPGKRRYAYINHRRQIQKKGTFVSIEFLDNMSDIQRFCK